VILLDRLLELRLLRLLVFASFGGLAVELFGRELHTVLAGVGVGGAGGGQQHTLRLKRAFSRPDMVGFRLSRLSHVSGCAVADA
jgi:hypothetical protein